MAANHKQGADDAIVLALVDGATVAAAAAGVSEKTVRRRRACGEFRARVEDLRARLMEQAATQLREALLLQPASERAKWNLELAERQKPPPSSGGGKSCSTVDGACTSYNAAACTCELLPSGVVGLTCTI